jgi:hypothetical protein
MALDPVTRSLERLAERVRDLEDRLAAVEEADTPEPVRVVACGP